MLQIHNSLSKQKETFVPITPGKVGMYVCGMTVYDYCHIGHARVLVVFDTVYRHLRASGYDVRYIRNITDVDDKIIARANERGVGIDQLTGEFIEAMHEDEASLGILRPTVEPRATENVPQMIALISQLIDTGFAYAGENGDVYYAVATFPGYGKLSGRKLDDLRAGERVAVDEVKRDPLDFVLWKAVKPDEPHWESPWGPGRPGWHIECSAMAAEQLGKHFDIHGGGMDLQFPHHENEIAQSEAAHGETFANIWMHNGFVRVDDEKMSKSLGNFFTIREVIQQYTPEEVRYFITASHYRSPLNYSQDQLENARASLRRMYTALRGLTPGAGEADASDPWVQRFHAAMDDDFNTPEALSVLFVLVAEINRQRDAGAVAQATTLAQTLVALGQRLGLLQAEPEAVLQGAASGATDAMSSEHIDTLIAERADARSNKNFARSDEIRDELAAAGVVLEDSGGTTTWRRQ